MIEIQSPYHISRGYNQFYADMSKIWQRNNYFLANLTHAWGESLPWLSYWKRDPATDLLGAHKSSNSNPYWTVQIQQAQSDSSTRLSIFHADFRVEILVCVTIITYIKAHVTFRNCALSVNSYQALTHKNVHNDIRKGMDNSLYLLAFITTLEAQWISHWKLYMWIGIRRRKCTWLCVLWTTFDWLCHRELFSLHIAQNQLVLDALVKWVNSNFREDQWNVKIKENHD